MSEETGSTPASEPVSQPAPEATPASTPQETPSQPSIKSEPTPRQSIDRAFAKMEQEAAKTPSPIQSTPEEQLKPDRTRNERGQFTARDPNAPVETQKAQPQSLETPPNRFSPEAKAAWSQAPEAIRAEVHRAVSEMERGLMGYQQIFEPIRPFMELAHQHGTSVPQALSQYLRMEDTLKQDPITGINEVLAYIGWTPQQYASAVMGQHPDQQRVGFEQTINDLRNEIAQLRSGFGQVQNTFQSQREEATGKMVEEFASQNPRLYEDDFANTVAKLLRTGMVEQHDLAGAYRMAEQLLPALQTAPASTAASRPQVQSRPANLSVTGAPASGSNPATRKPAATAKESIDRAFASLGIG